MSGGHPTHYDMNYPSPMTPGSTPLHERSYRDYSATPSPRRDWIFDSPSTPIRPQTRAGHSRAASYSQTPLRGPSFRAPYTYWDSPRYNAAGEYAARVDAPVDVSPKDSSRRHKASSSFQAPPRGDRRHSCSYVRASTPYGDSDEDEVIETLYGTYVLPAKGRSKSRRFAHDSHDYFYPVDPASAAAGRYTNLGGREQRIPSYYYPNGYDYPAYGPEPSSPYSPRGQPPQQHPVRPPTSHGHSRHASTSTPKRPSTVRPQSQRKSSKADTATATPRPATEADAKKHKIPTGYSLKNWDANERPILLLGSVFDTNSLGKWIFDWTVHRHGAGSPICDIAGDLWLLLIQLSAKVNIAEKTIGNVRDTEDHEMLQDFLDSGERLFEKLRSLLKACEAPMLKAAKKRQSGLGKSSGEEFVHTLFGVDRDGEKTDKFMQAIRLFLLRFDANCAEIILNPTR